jgi:hypothetical protein
VHDVFPKSPRGIRQAGHSTHRMCPIVGILTSTRQEPHAFLFYALEYPSEATKAQTLKEIEALKQRQIDTKARIVEQKRNGRVESVITESQASITELELLCSDLEDSLVELQSLLGPWRPSRIPHEILCQIFVYASESDPEQFPWDVMAVCGAWRRTASACSALWSTLHISSHLEPRNGSTRNDCRSFFYRKVPMSTPLAVRKAIRRARRGLLNVRLSFDEEQGVRCDCFARCLGVIGHQIKQVRSLDFDIGESPGIDLCPLLADSFSNLRFVRIRRYSPDFVAALASRAPLLHTIEFSGPHNFAPYIGQAFWPRICKLNLGCAWHGGLHNLSQLLSACRSLRSLGFGDRYEGPLWLNSLESAIPPHLPKLERMTCRLRLSAWALLSGATITTLYIGALFLGHRDWNNRNPHDWRTRGMTKIYLPKLKYLTCAESPAALWAAELFVAPSIVDLAILNLSALNPEPVQNSDRDKVWRSMSLRPHNVLLHWRPSPAYASFQSFIHLLHHLSDIRYLTLRGIRLHDAEGFVQQQGQKLCPNIDYIAWWLISDIEGVEEQPNSFYGAARECFGGPHTRWMIEQISRAEDDRTFFYVRIFHTPKGKFKLRTSCSQYMTLLTK